MERQKGLMSQNLIQCLCFLLTRASVHGRRDYIITHTEASSHSKQGIQLPVSELLCPSISKAGRGARREDARGLRDRGYLRNPLSYTATKAMLRGIPSHRERSVLPACGSRDSRNTLSGACPRETSLTITPSSLLPPQPPNHATSREKDSR